jgi:DNA-binding response OmpR family regulator
MHLSNSQVIILRTILKHEIASTAGIIEAVWPYGRDPESASNILRVQIHKIRKAFAPHGWRIGNLYGGHYAIPKDQKAAISAWIDSYRYERATR